MLNFYNLHQNIKPIAQVKLSFVGTRQFFSGLSLYSHNVEIKVSVTPIDTPPATSQKPPVRLGVSLMLRSKSIIVMACDVIVSDWLLIIRRNDGITFSRM